MSDTVSSICSCGGGADLGAEQAGLELDWAMEREAWKAEVYNQNLGNHCVVEDIRRADWSSFRTPFWWHASPPCTTASKANPNAGETLLDIALAAAIRRGISELRPRRFSLENVWGYTTYFSFRRIQETLQAEGYAFSHWHLDAANYGVPQNRKRLILVASLDHQPHRPIATHSKHAAPASQLGMFDDAIRPWRGWFDAVKHRIEEFTPSKWANWQVPRLPAEWAELQEPFLVGGGNTGFAGAAEGNGVRYADEPMLTIRAGRSSIRAFIMHGSNSGADGDRFRYDTEPRARISGRVVQLSVDALADLQDFPPNYRLPTTKTKACDIIGNAVPPGLMRAVIAANR